MAQRVRGESTGTDDDDQYRYNDIEGRFGVLPERFADYLALTGDAVDNIKGVPGVGPKDGRRR